MFLKDSCRSCNSSSLELVSNRRTGSEVTAFFEDILRVDSLLRVRVTGRSMKPFLRGGEILTIKKASARSLKRGDLIFFKCGNGESRVHRLIGREKDGAGMVSFRTKGDALISFDEPVAAADIMGKISGIEGRISVDMESRIWAAINYTLAVTHSIKSMVLLTLAACMRRLHPIS